MALEMKNSFSASIGVAYRSNRSWSRPPRLIPGSSVSRADRRTQKSSSAAHASISGQASGWARAIGAAVSAGGRQAPVVPAQDLDGRGPPLVHGFAPQRPCPGQRAVPVQLAAGAGDVPHGRTDRRHADAEEVQVTLEVPLGLPGPL